MNLRRTICAGTLLTGAMISAGIAQGQVQTVNTLVLTENSSTSLTWDLNGVSHTITPGPSGPDRWIFTLAGLSTSSSVTFVGWQEPSETTFNFITVNTFGSPTEVLINSDAFGSGISGLPNGATDKTHFTLNGAELDVTFTDNGDISTVPDTATTLPLLSLGLAALGFAKRRLF